MTTNEHTQIRISEPTLQTHAAAHTNYTRPTLKIEFPHRQLPPTVADHPLTFSQSPTLIFLTRCASPEPSGFNIHHQKCPPQTPARRPARLSPTWCRASTPSTSTSGYVESKKETVEKFSMNSFQLDPPSHNFPLSVNENRFCEQIGNNRGGKKIGQRTHSPEIWSFFFEEKQCVCALGCGKKKGKSKTT